MQSPETQNDVTQAYAQVKDYLWKLSFALARRYRMEQDEVFAEMNLHFLRGHQVYDPSRGYPYARFIGIFVYQRIKHLAKKNYTRSQRAATLSLSEFGDTLPCPVVRNSRVMDNLSDKACFVLNLAARMEQRPNLRHPRVSFRIRRYLRRIGWKKKAISSVFHELAGRKQKYTPVVGV